MMVDDQDSLLSGLESFERCDVAAGWLLRQLIGPGFNESRTVDFLIFFCAGRNVGPAGRSLVMNDLAERLIKSFVTMAANLKSQVGIFVISWRVFGIEAPETFEE